MTNNLLRRLFFLLVIVIVSVALFPATLLPPMSRLLDVSAPVNEPVEFVVPLPGDDNTRTLTAAALVRRGLADRVGLLQGTPSPRVLDGIEPPGHAVTEAVLAARGLTEQQIVPIVGNSTGTLTDMQLVGQLLEQHAEARVAIVSNAYHLRRARWSARRALGEEADRLYFVAAPLDHWGHDNWWRDAEGVSSIASEYSKLGFYVVRYGSLGQRAALVAASILLLAVLIAVGRRAGSGGRRAVG